MRYMLKLDRSGRVQMPDVLEESSLVIQEISCPGYGYAIISGLRYHFIAHHIYPQLKGHAKTQRVRLEGDMLKIPENFTGYFKDRKANLLHYSPYFVELWNDEDLARFMHNYEKENNLDSILAELNKKNIHI